jgi:hypothetical protein
MALHDIVFTDGDKQNFIVEVPVGLCNAPLDMLTEPSTNPGFLCLETPLIEIPDNLAPEVILLSDGKLAKRISDKFYLKL